MYLKILALAAVLSCAFTSHGQDTVKARALVDTLTSPYFWGRGYTNDGMHKAADFIAAQLKQYGLTPANGSSYFQHFTYPVNTFPGKMEVTINGVRLVAGKDFIIAEESKGLNAEGNLVKQDSTHFIDPINRLVVELRDKLTWSVAPSAENYTAVYIDKKALNKDPETIKLNIENKEVAKFNADNVLGMVKGTHQPDSLIVITAHYDHLGGMGSGTYFPGANDNASGMAMLLTLAAYYAQHPAPYSILFICFAGEEAGLIGSKYFTTHPTLNLSSIRFLLNIDLAGTGNEGITVVNATEYPFEYKLLNKVNDNGMLLSKINARGKAANSDHYWFTEKGVPSFFIYTLGGIKAYHDVFDISATLPMEEYNDLFKLIVGFNSGLMQANQIR